MKTPVLLLDVDGVLAPFGCETEGYEWHPSMQLFFSKANPGHLRRLGEFFQLVWATAWEDEANSLLCPLLELDPLPLVKFGTSRRDGQIYLPPDVRFDGFSTWKLPWIIDWAGNNRPLAWIDDDLRPDAFHWAEMRDVPTLLIRTDANLGLTVAHVEQLCSWADGLQHSFKD